jgi:hypothetical protein
MSLFCHDDVKIDLPRGCVPKNSTAAATRFLVDPYYNEVFMLIETVI